MKVLAFGGWGQLGSDLAAVAGERGHELVRPRHAEVDVTDAPAVRASALNGAWVATSSSAAVRSQRAPRRWL